MYSRSSTIKIGSHRKKPRIWLEGKWLGKAGFTPGNKINVDIHSNKVTIYSDSSGNRTVSGKKKNTIPVIDINTNELAFNCDTCIVTANENKITITPSYTVCLMTSRILAPTEASLFSGGGILSLSAKLCGFQPKVAVEINPTYAGIYEENHPGAHMFNMSASEVPYGELERFKPIGLFTAGIPCEPFSRSRRVNKNGMGKKDTSLVPETHDLGDMTFWCLRNIEALNPHTVLIEEVPDFLNSGAGNILLHVLKRLYRYVDSKIINPIDYGSMTGRKRAVIIAQDNPITWPVPCRSDKTLTDIFDPEPHEWFNRETKSWLFNHWDKQTAKGNGFASNIYTGNDTHIGTIKKRYFSGQGDGLVIAHPTLKDTYRWLTLNEVKKLHSIPEDYLLPESKTRAGEILGQAVVVDTFQKIIQSVTT